MESTVWLEGTSKMRVKREPGIAVATDTTTDMELDWFITEAGCPDKVLASSSDTNCLSTKGNNRAQTLPDDQLNREKLQVNCNYRGREYNRFNSDIKHSQVGSNAQLTEDEVSKRQLDVKIVAGEIDERPTCDTRDGLSNRYEAEPSDYEIIHGHTLNRSYKPRTSVAASNGHISHTKSAPSNGQRSYAQNAPSSARSSYNSTTAAAQATSILEPFSPIFIDHYLLAYGLVACNGCGFTTKQFAVMATHLFQMHNVMYDSGLGKYLTILNVSEFSCPLCAVTSSDKFTMELHKVSHINNLNVEMPCVTTGNTVGNNVTEEPPVTDKLSAVISKKSKRQLSLANQLKRQQCPKVKCSHCKFKTYLHQSLLAHVRYKHSSQTKVFICQHCDFEAHSNRGLRMHVRHKHTRGKKLLTCQHCKFTCHRREILVNHNRTKHPLQCQVSVSKKSKCQKKSKVQRQKFFCAHCEFSTYHRRGLHTHVRSQHSKRKTFSCKYCHFMSHGRKHIVNHERREHAKEVIDISWEVKIVIDAVLNQLESNKTVARGIERGTVDHSFESYLINGVLSCTECKFTTKYEKGFAYHMFYEHGNKDPLFLKYLTTTRKDKVTCSYCKYSGYCKKSLESHMLIHHSGQ